MATLTVTCLYIEQNKFIKNQYFNLKYLFSIRLRFLEGNKVMRVARSYNLSLQIHQNKYNMVFSYFLQVIFKYFPNINIYKHYLPYRF